MPKRVGTAVLKEVENTWVANTKLSGKDIFDFITRKYRSKVISLRKVQLVVADLKRRQTSSVGVDRFDAWTCDEGTWAERLKVLQVQTLHENRTEMMNFTDTQGRWAIRLLYLEPDLGLHGIDYLAQEFYHRESLSRYNGSEVELEDLKRLLGFAPWKSLWHWTRYVRDYVNKSTPLPDMTEVVFIHDDEDDDGRESIFMFTVFGFEAVLKMLVDIVTNDAMMVINYVDGKEIREEIMNLFKSSPVFFSGAFLVPGEIDCLLRKAFPQMPEHLYEDARGSMIQAADKIRKNLKESGDYDDYSDYVDTKAYQAGLERQRTLKK